MVAGGSAVYSDVLLVQFVPETCTQAHKSDFKFGHPAFAQDYLGIPGTTVDLEQRFSVVGDMVTKKKNRLKGETVRVMQGLKGWIDAGLYDIVGEWGRKNRDVRK